MEAESREMSGESESLVQTLLLEQDPNMGIPRTIMDSVGVTSEMEGKDNAPNAPGICLARSSVQPLLKSSSSIKILSPVGSSSNRIFIPGHVKIIKGSDIHHGTDLNLLPNSDTTASTTSIGSTASSSSSSLSLSSLTANKKPSQLLKSPIKLSSTKIPPKAIVIGSSQSNASGKQVIFQPGSDSQRIIRLPTGNTLSSPQSSSTSNIFQINNSKVQYVKVALPPTTSGSSTSISNKQPTGTTESLKIALPPSTKSIVHQRKILPARRVIMPTSESSAIPANSGASPRYLPIAPLIELKEQDDPSNKRLLVDSLSSSSIAPAPAIASSSVSSVIPSTNTIEVSSGVRLRKPCNCSKSQCLKLYCDCFANGEFCYNCNCFNCYNNLEHEEDRQRSIRSCLERNSNAFRPKIGRGSNNEGERVHHKGCNCKRSSCLKNYCECYEAKIPCTNACRCVACKNVEEFSPLTGPVSSAISSQLANNGSINITTTATSNHFTTMNNTTMNNNNNDFSEQHPHSNGGCGYGAEEVPVSADDPMESILPLLKKEIKPSLKSRLTPFINASSDASKSDKKAFSFVNNEVIGATCQCLLTQAEEAEKSELPESKIEALILEEFGRCLKQIIDISKRNKPN